MDLGCLDSGLIFITKSFKNKPFGPGLGTVLGLLNNVFLVPLNGFKNMGSALRVPASPDLNSIRFNKWRILSVYTLCIKLLLVIIIRQIG